MRKILEPNFGPIVLLIILTFQSVQDAPLFNPRFIKDPRRFQAKMINSQFDVEYLYKLAGWKYLKNNLRTFLPFEEYYYLETNCKRVEAMNPNDTMKCRHNKKGRVIVCDIKDPPVDINHCKHTGDKYDISVKDYRALNYVQLALKELNSHSHNVHFFNFTRIISLKREVVIGTKNTIAFDVKETACSAKLMFELKEFSQCAWEKDPKTMSCEATIIEPILSDKYLVQSNCNPTDESKTIPMPNSNSTSMPFKAAAKLGRLEVNPADIAHKDKKNATAPNPIEIAAQKILTDYANLKNSSSSMPSTMAADVSEIYSSTPHPAHQPDSKLSKSETPVVDVMPPSTNAQSNEQGKQDIPQGTGQAEFTPQTTEYRMAINLSDAAKDIPTKTSLENKKVKEESKQDVANTNASMTTESKLQKKNIPWYEAKAEYTPYNLVKGTAPDAPSNVSKGDSGADHNATVKPDVMQGIQFGDSKGYNTQTDAKTPKINSTSAQNEQQKLGEKKVQPQAAAKNVGQGNAQIESKNVEEQSLGQAGATNESRHGGEVKLNGVAQAEAKNESKHSKELSTASLGQAATRNESKHLEEEINGVAKAEAKNNTKHSQETLTSNLEQAKTHNESNHVGKENLNGIAQAEAQNEAKLGEDIIIRNEDMLPTSLEQADAHNERNQVGEENLNGVGQADAQNMDQHSEDMLTGGQVGIVNENNNAGEQEKINNVGQDGGVDDFQFTQADDGDNSHNAGDVEENNHFLEGNIETLLDEISGNVLKTVSDKTMAGQPKFEMYQAKPAGKADPAIGPDPKPTDSLPVEDAQGQKLEPVVMKTDGNITGETGQIMNGDVPKTAKALDDGKSEKKIGKKGVEKVSVNKTKASITKENGKTNQEGAVNEKAKGKNGNKQTKAQSDNNKVEMAKSEKKDETENDKNISESPKSKVDKKDAKISKTNKLKDKKGKSNSKLDDGKTKISNKSSDEAKKSFAESDRAGAKSKQQNHVNKTVPVKKEQSKEEGSTKADTLQDSQATSKGKEVPAEKAQDHKKESSTKKDISDDAPGESISNKAPVEKEQGGEAESSVAKMGDSTKTDMLEDSRAKLEDEQVHGDETENAAKIDSSKVDPVNPISKTPDGQDKLISNKVPVEKGLGKETKGSAKTDISDKSKDDPGKEKSVETNEPAEKHVSKESSEAQPVSEKIPDEKDFASFSANKAKEVSASAPGDKGKKEAIDSEKLGVSSEDKQKTDSQTTGKNSAEISSGNEGDTPKENQVDRKVPVEMEDLTKKEFSNGGKEAQITKNSEQKEEPHEGTDILAKIEPSNVNTNETPVESQAKLALHDSKGKETSEGTTEFTKSEALKNADKYSMKKTTDSNGKATSPLKVDSVIPNVESVNKEQSKSSIEGAIESQGDSPKNDAVINNKDEANQKMKVSQAEGEASLKDSEQQSNDSKHEISKHIQLDSAKSKISNLTNDAEIPGQLASKINGNDPVNPAVGLSKELDATKQQTKQNEDSGKLDVISSKIPSDKLMNDSKKADFIESDEHDKTDKLKTEEAGKVSEIESKTPLEQDSKISNFYEPDENKRDTNVEQKLQREEPGKVAIESKNQSEKPGKNAVVSGFNEPDEAKINSKVPNSEDLGQQNLTESATDKSKNMEEKLAKDSANKKFNEPDAPKTDSEGPNSEDLKKHNLTEHALHNSPPNVHPMSADLPESQGKKTSSKKDAKSTDKKKKGQTSEHRKIKKGDKSKNPKDEDLSSKSEDDLPKNNTTSSAVKKEKSKNPKDEDLTSKSEDDLPKNNTKSSAVGKEKSKNPKDEDLSSKSEDDLPKNKSSAVGKEKSKNPKDEDLSSKSEDDLPKNNTKSSAVGKEKSKNPKDEDLSSKSEDDLPKNNTQSSAVKKEKSKYPKDEDLSSKSENDLPKNNTKSSAIKKEKSKNPKDEDLSSKSEDDLPKEKTKSKAVEKEKLNPKKGTPTSKSNILEKAKKPPVPKKDSGGKQKEQNKEEKQKAPGKNKNTTKSDVQTMSGDSKLPSASSKSKDKVKIEKNKKNPVKSKSKTTGKPTSHSSGNVKESSSLRTFKAGNVGHKLDNKKTDDLYAMSATSVLPSVLKPLFENTTPYTMSDDLSGNSSKKRKKGKRGKKNKKKTTLKNYEEKKEDNENLDLDTMNDDERIESADLFSDSGKQRKRPGVKSKSDESLWEEFFDDEDEDEEEGEGEEGEELGQEDENEASLVEDTDEEDENDEGDDDEADNVYYYDGLEGYSFKSGKPFVMSGDSNSKKDNSKNATAILNSMGGAVENFKLNASSLTSSANETDANKNSKSKTTKALSETSKLEISDSNAKSVSFKSSKENTKTVSTESKSNDDPTAEDDMENDGDKLDTKINSKTNPVGGTTNETKREEINVIVAKTRPDASNYESS